MRTAVRHSNSFFWYLAVTLVSCWAGLFSLLYRALR
jgi:hypothetical protein